MFDRLGLELMQGYGLTETAGTVTIEESARRHPGSVGKALAGVEVRLIEDRQPVEPGDRGEIWIRTPSAFDGYLDDPVSTAEVLLSDGWCRTGDIGVQDDDGTLYLVGRSKDLINVAGFNVYPAEVEAVLEQHESVRHAVVVGEPHPVSGERVIAYVVAASPRRRPPSVSTRSSCTAAIASPATRSPSRSMWSTIYQSPPWGSGRAPSCVDSRKQPILIDHVQQVRTRSTVATVRRARQYRTWDLSPAAPRPCSAYCRAADPRQHWPCGVFRRSSEERQVPMLRKARSAEGVVSVTFTVSASVAGHAEHVHFVGEPTGWIPVPMHHNPDGSFELTIELAAGGRYAFRYRLDERWYNDDTADDYTPNQYGGHNAIVAT